MQKVRYAIGVNMGYGIVYIKSIRGNKFNTTENLKMAKKYGTMDYVCGEIDTLARISEGRYIFNIVEVM